MRGALRCRGASAGVSAHLQGGGSASTYDPSVNPGPEDAAGLPVAVMNLRELEASVTASETEVFEKLDLEARLGRCLREPGGVGRFGEAFYFIRVEFVQLNFLVGARVEPAREELWRGLVRSLCEELGANGHHSHNALYRRFLAAAGAAGPTAEAAPDFARRFNDGWRRLAVTGSLEDALAALAVYEILDDPDYALLHRVLRPVGLTDADLEFFSVHASARHFDLFSDSPLVAAGSPSLLNRAADFVLQSQEQMWRGLLEYLHA